MTFPGRDKTGQLLSHDYISFIGKMKCQPVMYQLMLYVKSVCIFEKRLQRCIMIIFYFGTIKSSGDGHITGSTLAVKNSHLPKTLQNLFFSSIAEILNLG